MHKRNANPTPAQCPAVTVIKFNGLLIEAGRAFRGGDYTKAEELLAEARVMTAFERRLIGAAS